MGTKEPTRSDAPYEIVNIVRFKEAASEVIHTGPVRLDVLEDGRNTGQRLGAVLITLPPKTPGPPQHWHQMHDETFLVMKGTATFTSREEKIIAKEGDYVVVPLFAPHTFANDTDEEVVIYNTFTPSFYVNYFRLMGKMVAQSEEGELTPAMHREAMERYATLQLKGTKQY